MGKLSSKITYKIFRLC